MIWKYRLNSLIEEEKALLVEIVKKYDNKYFKEYNDLVYFKLSYIQSILLDELKNIKEEHRWMVASILRKLMNLSLNISIPPFKVDEHNNLLLQFDKELPTIKEEDK